MKHVTRKLESDKQVIEIVVRKFGPISCTGIHELTHIRRSATSQLVRELVREKRLIEAGRISKPKRPGRKQVLFRLNEDFRFIAGIEFDEEKVVASVLNLRPRIRQTVTEPAELGAGRDGLVKQLISCVKKALQQAELDGSSLLGIGIADPGLVDSQQGVTVMSSTIDFWNQVPLKAIFEQEFGVPTLVETKTRAKTVAERVLGAGELRDNMIYIDYGAGIGAGIILDGKLFYGQNCAAGEFGHTQTMEDGPVCMCGSFGCLEAVAGARAVESRIRQAIAEGGCSQVLSLVDGAPDKIDVWTVLKAARRGDKICSNIVAEMGRYLASGLANLINLFNPSVIVLDQRLELAGQGLLDQLLRIIKRKALTYSSEHAAVRFGRVGAEAGVLGVVLMVLEKHFEIPILKPPRFMIEAVLPLTEREHEESEAGRETGIIIERPLEVTTVF